jgi:methyltransferase
MDEILGFNTRSLYIFLILAMIGVRLLELRLANSNTNWARRQGGIEVGEEHYPWMVALHAWFFLACPLEVWILSRSFSPLLAAAMFAALLAAMVLRLWVIETLGNRWTTRVICLPGLPVISSGPYRFLRHPNYLAVMIETVALPMIHSAWITALVFGMANGLLLRIRIRSEEAALKKHTNWASLFEDKDGFDWPKS